MLKSSLLTVAALWVSAASYAQFVTNGNNTTTNNNVGIGTTSPATRLEVFNSSDAQLLIHSSGGDGTNTELNLLGGAAGASWAIGTNKTVAGGAADNLFFYKGSGTAGTKLVIRDNGNVGIGTATPNAKLDVAGSIFAQGGESHFAANGYSDPHPGVAHGVKVGSDGIAVNGNSLFVNGNIQMGTNAANSNLDVNGTIHTREVKVDTQNFPDFVFKPTYTLPSLKEVKNYIDEKGHLPGMPSEAEAIKDGISLGEMNKKLLQKVEELTLYLIEKDKELKQQRVKDQQQEKRIKALEHKLSKHK